MGRSKNVGRIIRKKGGKYLVMKIKFIPQCKQCGKTGLLIYIGGKQYVCRNCKK